MQTSSDDLIVVTNEIGISGVFLGLARNGQLFSLSDAIHDRGETVRNLVEVEGKLKACNNPAKLAEFEKWCRKGKRDFESRLRQVVTALEDRKCQLLDELHKMDQRLDRKELGIEWEFDSNVTMTSLVPRGVRKSDPSIAKRNEIIDANIERTDLEICKLLDQELGWLGEGSNSLPKSWERRHEVDTFVGAYHHAKCRNNLHKLISVRRSLRSYHRH